MNSEKIKIENGKLVVPYCAIIPYIEGDGIEPDIWKTSILIFDAAVEKADQSTKRITCKKNANKICSGLELIIQSKKVTYGFSPHNIKYNFS